MSLTDQTGPHDLLPCPFCGSTPALLPPCSEDQPSPRIECPNCGPNNEIQTTYYQEKATVDVVAKRWNARAHYGPTTHCIPPGRINLDRLDDAVLALLALNILSPETAYPEPYADPQVDRQALTRLRQKGMLAQDPSIIPGRGIHLSAEGARRAHELFRKLFCD